MFESKVKVKPLAVDGHPPLEICAPRKNIDAPERSAVFLSVRFSACRNSLLLPGFGPFCHGSHHVSETSRTEAHIKVFRTDEGYHRSNPVHYKARGGNWLEARVRRLLLETWQLSPTAVQKHPLYPLYVFLGTLYGRISGLNQKRLLARSGVLPRPVISIGNLVAGGTGKTPMVLWIHGFLKKQGLHPVVLSRGYGGRTGRGSLFVDTRPEGASIYGDEPVLMARKGLNVRVGRNRLLSGMKALEASAPDLFLLDDGFQHVQLHRDLDLVLLDAERPLGNGLLLPFGPLREPPENLHRADAFVLTRAVSGSAERATRDFLSRRHPSKPIFACRHRITGFRRGLCGREIPLRELQNGPVAAFSGLANPRGFFESLKELGIEPRSCFAFPDHHKYETSELRMILETAQKASARYILTTEKDFVRVPCPFPFDLVTAQLDIEFDQDRRPFEEFLQQRLARMFAQERLHRPDGRSAPTSPPCDRFSGGRRQRL